MCNRSAVLDSFNDLMLINMKYIIIFIAILTTSAVFAQNVEFEKANFRNDVDGLKQAKKRLKEGAQYWNMVGEEAFSSKEVLIWKMPYRQYQKALPPFMAAHKFNPNNAELNYRIGLIYFKTKNSDKAIEFLLKAKSLNVQVHRDIDFYLAMAYHLNYEFDIAIKTFKTFHQNLRPDEIPAYDKVVLKKIKECEIAKQLLAKPTRVFIDNAGPNINSKYPDYSPVISADGQIMFFTSRRNTTTGGEWDNNQEGYFEDILQAEKDENGNWKKAQQPLGELNSSAHDAVVGLSADGQSLYVFKTDGDLYISKLDGDSWGKPTRLNKNINSSYKESSASFSNDYLSIYFVSERENGFGGKDIYVSRKNEKGKWGEAKSMGPEINSPYDEEGIFAHPDGKTFYYSSKGKGSMGGYDIFKIVFENNKWSQPVNLGYPINTPGDDVFFRMNASGTQGFYSSSSRDDAVGSFDIYSISFLGKEKQMIFNTEDNLLSLRTGAILEKVLEPVVEIQTSNVTLLKGTISDQFSGEPLFASIQLTDLKENKVIATFETNKKTGKYLVTLPSGKNYGIAVNSENCLFHSENIDIANSNESYQELIKNIKLKRIEVGSSVVLKNIFFDTGKATLRDESKTELDALLELMTEIATLEIEISGHTDNVGSANSNKSLSERRAKAVVEHLIASGISSSRLTYKGYGFDKPVASNDTKEGRQQNRRTEFEITKR